MRKKYKKRTKTVIALTSVMLAVLIILNPWIPVLLCPIECVYTAERVHAVTGETEFKETWVLTKEETLSLASIFRWKVFVRKDFTESTGFMFWPTHKFEFKFPFGIKQTFYYDDFKYDCVKVSFPGSYYCINNGDDLKLIGEIYLKYYKKHIY
ncbi:MAG: hypothetical protein IJD86_13420 [Clostridia bacterium]|nr:hypothetical protein [Clostridia bacterium]